jgi:DnaD/phage-associated family protein
MAKYRMVRIDFWRNPIVLEEMSPEDKYFYLYLLTNPNTTQIGIYRITKKQMAFDLGYSIETVHSLMDRFIHHHKVIRYNPETRELAIKSWGKYNLQKGGKPIMDCIYSELKEVEDTSLIQYVSESIQKNEIGRLYESFCQPEENSFNKDVRDQNEHTYLVSEGQNAINTNEVIKPDQRNLFNNRPKQDDVKEIIEFWDNNGFGLSNTNAKQQLLTRLGDSRFSQPKQVFLKALEIACANNKQKLNYVVGILKNWENESLLTIEEIDSYLENPNPVLKSRQSTELISYGRAIPSGFELNLSAGEDW